MIEYRVNFRSEARRIAELREAVGWNRMEKSLSDMRMTSFVRIAAYDGDELVGYADSVSNGVTDAYIQDVMVRPGYQGKGIGTELMRRIISEISMRGVYMISVIYDQSLSGFYRRFGFNEMMSGQLQMREEE